MSGTTWSKFFWSDWFSEPALRLCSYAARGLWIDMLCIAATHDPIGYVAVAGRGLDETSIARMTGGLESEVPSLLGELERNGVFSRDRHGRIYSRRMVADARRAATARKNGKKGGNPSLGKTEVISASDNPQDKGGLKPQEPEAIFQKEENADAFFVAQPPADPARSPKSRTYPPDFELAWKAYPHHAGRSSKPRSLDQWRKLPIPERVELVRCIERFRGQVEAVCGGKGAPCMSRWLNDGKHLNWADGVGASQFQEEPQDPTALWRSRCRTFAKNAYWNSVEWGPKPGREGCTAPPEILREFGIEPAKPAPIERVA